MSLLRKPTGTSPLRWDAERGWYMNVSSGKPPMALVVAAKFALPYQESRYASYPPGALKDECWKSVLSLRRTCQAIHPSQVEIEQRIITKGDVVLFNSDKKEHGDHDRLILDLGGK